MTADRLPPSTTFAVKRELPRRLLGDPNPRAPSVIEWPRTETLTVDTTPEALGYATSMLRALIGRYELEDVRPVAVAVGWRLYAQVKIRILSRLAGWSAEGSDPDAMQTMTSGDVVFCGVRLYPAPGLSPDAAIPLVEAGDAFLSERLRERLKVGT